MASKMKPLPKAMIVLAAVGAIVFGGKMAMNSQSFKDLSEAPATQTTVSVTPTRTETNTTVSVAPQAAGDTLSRIIKSGTVHASVQAPSAPFYFVEGGQPRGFNVEFMKVLFSQSEFGNSPITIDTSKSVDTYPEVPEQLVKSKSIDIAIDGLTFGNDEPAGVVYTTPYIEDFGYALIGPSNSTIRGVDDMDGRVIGVLQGDPDVKAYAQKHLRGATIVELSDASVNGQRDWMSRAIKSGKVDAIVYDYPFGVAETKGTDLQFLISKLPEYNLKYRIGVRKQDQELLTALNMAIRKAKNDPAYTELLRKYFMSTNVAAVKTATKTESTYTVKQGDTLSTIAAAILGDRMQYTAIEARNNLPNPNLIRVGQVLVIPRK